MLRGQRQARGRVDQHRGSDREQRIAIGSGVLRSRPSLRRPVFVEPDHVGARQAAAEHSAGRFPGGGVIPGVCGVIPFETLDPLEVAVAFNTSRLPARWCSPSTSWVICVFTGIVTLPTSDSARRCVYDRSRNHFAFYFSNMEDGTRDAGQE